MSEQASKDAAPPPLGGIAPEGDGAKEGRVSAIRQLRRPQLGPATVLLVDDDELVRKMTCRSLEYFGCSVIMAASGAEAIALYQGKQTPIDLVLLDMTMPGLNGIETLRALRRLDPAVRAIVASGMDAEGVRQENANAGVSAVLQKPYRTKELADTIARVLGGSAG